METVIQKMIKNDYVLQPLQKKVPLLVRGHQLA